MENVGIVTQATGDNIIRHLHFSCCVTKTRDTHSEYVILVAFPLKQWLQEHLNVTLYVHCLSCFTALPVTSRRQKVKLSLSTA